MCVFVCVSVRACVRVCVCVQVVGHALSVISYKLDPG